MFIVKLLVTATVHSPLRFLLPLAFVHGFSLSGMSPLPSLVFLSHSSSIKTQPALHLFLTAFLGGLCESFPGPIPHSFLLASVANLRLFFSSCLRLGVGILCVFICSWEPSPLADSLFITKSCVHLSFKP